MEPSPRPMGAGAGPLAACPQGFVQPLGLVAPLAPPTLGGMAEACSSVSHLSPLMPWAMQWAQSSKMCNESLLPWAM